MEDFSRPNNIGWQILLLIVPGGDVDKLLDHVYHVIHVY